MNNFLIILVSIISLFLINILRNLIVKKRKDKLSNALNANYFLETINKLIEENKYNLLEERIRLKDIDAYGNEDLKKWIGNPPLDEVSIEKSINYGSKRFKEGIPYFWEKVILKQFSGQECFFEKWKSYRIINPIINDEIIGTSRNLEKEDWFIFIASQIEKTCLNLIENNTSKTNNQNYKKGIIFENNCMEILKKKGWKVKETPITGDQGVDLIASINNLRICIQCKNHKKAVGNNAVQEISAGKSYWKGTHAVLVSKSGFTKSAQKLARANKVKLINYFELKDLENFLN
ncbi:restriction endonuclease [Prochlorococcus sp. AH-716-K03]|nr:restriction endonuclease [Prochlorococcus sp. AH-716-K03]